MVKIFGKGENQWKGKRFVFTYVSSRSPGPTSVLEMNVRGFQSGMSLALNFASYQLFLSLNCQRSSSTSSVAAAATAPRRSRLVPGVTGYLSSEARRVSELNTQAQEIEILVNVEGK